jgi:cysteine-rich repeat protein
MKLNRLGIALFASSSLAALSGCGGERTPTENPAPRVVNFVAEPASVGPGQTTTLRYQVVGAETLRIDTEAGVNVLPETSNPQAMGSIVTPTLNMTTTFVLKASNAAGDSMSSVTVTVTDPNGPQINSFSATPAAITDGMSSTLSWQTTNAVSGRIELDGTAITTLDGASIGAGTFDVTPNQTRTYKLVVAGSAGAEVSQDVTVTVTPANGPVVRSFTATPATIEAGQSSTLSWDVGNAQSVSITDGAGQSVYSGGDLTGTQAVTPTQTTTYTLTAQDGNNMSATRTVTVTVNAPAGASITSFTAQPTAVDPGNSSTLSWQVSNAPGGIEIAAGGSVLHSDTQASGTFAVTPAQATTYTLTAKNPNGDATATVTVTVNAPPALGITSFTANPTVGALNGTATLSWTTVAATQVRILAGANELNSSANNTGTYAATLSAEVNTFTLEASAPGQTTLTQSVTVYAHAAPVIRSFTVNPTTISGPATITVAWDVTDVSGLTLNLGGNPVPGFPQVASTTVAVDSMGTFAVQVTGASTFQLVATSAGGTVNQTAQVTVVTGVPEVEPNDLLNQAQVLPPPGLVQGALTADDVDIFRITVADGGNVTAVTSDGAGGCATDTVLILADLAGNTITFDEDSGATGGCSRIDPTVDPAAGDLPAGDYLIGVIHQLQTGTGPYTLQVTVGTSACGNDILETRANEQCDAGDTTNGDGCDATCQLEIHPTVISGTGGTVQVTLPNPRALATIRVNVTTAGSAITAIAADAGGTTCNNADTALNLGDANLGLLGGKADGGPTGAAGTCAAIVFPTDTFATDLAAGTYYLVVFNTAPSAAGPVTLTVSIQPPMCGNSVVETRAGEQCDDPAGTGTVPCNNQCQVQAAGTATLPGGGPVTLPGGFASGFQLFQVTVTQELYLRAETFAPNQAGGCNADTVIELYDSAFTFLGGDDEGGTNSCSRMDEDFFFTRLAPGTYWVVVSEYSSAGIPAYTLVLDALVVNGASPRPEVEPDDTQATAVPTGLNGPGTVQLHGQVAADGDADVYAFGVPANTTVTFSARTYDTMGAPTACTANNDVTDTRIFLEQAGVEATAENTGELAFSDDISATQWCSAITGQSLTGGASGATYYVRVQGYNDLGPRQYFLQISLQ